ncbi:MAG TPA: type I restriction-modification enzyme R subunit C-terminal domain-containing protein [Propionibacteriaceae bacterium]|nr:type I restriction-modification enzyme R subunit C-terminal domain-containing protein [Propionibacteriaceae bacterium]
MGLARLGRRSVSKFWQMIGRGTRLRRDLYGPGEDKRNFYVFDFCMNLEYFNQPGAGSEGSLQKSLGQRLFETRVGLVSALDERGLDPDGLRTDTARWLHSVVAGMNLDNVIVRGKREWVQRYGEWSAWASLPTHTAGDIATHLGGLPSTVRDDDEQAKRFDIVMLTIQLAVLDDDHQTADRLRRGVQAIASNLLAQTAIPAVAAQEELLAEVADDDWWVDVTLPMLELGRKRVRGLVRFLDKAHRATVYTDLADELGESTVVALPGVSVGTNWERFKAKVRAYLAEHDDNISLQRLRRNRQLTLADLIALEDMLVASGAGGPGDVARAREESQGLGLFIRSLVGLDRSAASEAFSEFLTDSRLGVTEIRFIQMIVEHLTANGVMPAARLYEAPFTDFAPQGPDVLFSEDAVDRMVMILDDVRATALPA